MKIFALTVGKNESDRYLKKVLEWTSSFVDGHYFYDDQSLDGTLWVAAEYATVRERPDDVPSFMQHEGIFRQAAYKAMQEDLVLQDGDWVISLDCDEFLVSYNEREDLERVIAEATEQGFHAVKFPVVEIFGYVGDRLGYRTDGYWNEISATRLFEFTGDGGEIPCVEMGGGSVPAYSAYVPEEPTISLLHVGYLQENEREVKYERYVNKKGNGHNPRHIRSIVSPPQLEPWPGKTPPCLL